MKDAGIKEVRLEVGKICVVGSLTDPEKKLIKKMLKKRARVF